MLRGLSPDLVVMVLGVLTLGLYAFVQKSELKDVLLVLISGYFGWLSQNFKPPTPPRND